MGASIGAVTAASAAAAARRQREFLDRFRQQGATEPARAIPMPEYPGVRGRAHAERLIRRGFVRAAPGGYWLDEAALEAARRVQTRVVLVVIAVLLVILGAGVLVYVGAGPATPVNQ